MPSQRQSPRGMPSSRRPREVGSRYHRKDARPQGKDARTRRAVPKELLTYRCCSSSTPTSLAGCPGRSEHDPGAVTALAPHERARRWSPLGAWERRRGSWTRRGGLCRQHCRLGGGQRRGAPPPCPACGPSRGGGRRRRPAQQAARGDRPGGAIPGGGTSPWITRGAGGGKGRGADAEGRNNLKTQRVVLFPCTLFFCPPLSSIWCSPPPFHSPLILLYTPLRPFSLLSFTLLPFFSLTSRPPPLTLSSPHFPPSISSLSPFTLIHPSIHPSIHCPPSSPPFFSFSPVSFFLPSFFPSDSPIPLPWFPVGQDRPRLGKLGEEARRKRPQITQSGPGAGVLPRLKSTPASQQHLPLKHLSRSSGALVRLSHRNRACSEKFQTAPGGCLFLLSHRTASGSMKLTVMLCLGTSPW